MFKMKKSLSMLAAAVLCCGMLASCSSSEAVAEEGASVFKHKFLVHPYLLLYTILPAHTVKTVVP